MKVPTRASYNFFYSEWHRRFADYTTALERRLFEWEHFEGTPMKPPVIKVYPASRGTTPFSDRAYFRRIPLPLPERDAVRAIEATRLTYEFTAIGQVGEMVGSLRECIHFVQHLCEVADAAQRLGGGPS